jgi:formylmethanofuran dehydrogenase subunit E
MVEKILSNSLITWVKCDQCGNKHAEDMCYRNNKTGKIWCGFCLSKEKKKRLDNYIRPEYRD